ncbi:lipase family protein [Bradyrhizobium genosp. L]|uniref:lipase family protein n=1 Tax=Bradyrhizobium genosp. L TaxID=83637 RepID=UPI0018A3299E|nr:lipase family protein [Bradyrhizobium genosp. L]QPF86896.1 lipase family protein [Bradyrhizobium genosp. L]
MSFLVAISRGAYPDAALKTFAASPSFAIDDAKAMMWMSQLAYETNDPGKVKDILTAWQLELKGLASNDPVTGLPPHSACFVAAAGRNATIIAFSGTDPLKIEDWITDFTAIRSVDGLHGGFKDAVDTVWPQIAPIVRQRPAGGLFFTGHSLGGALAVIAAERAMRELGATAAAVTTFGGPRVGGLDFFNSYTPALGDRTFRMVHGDDVVPTVPPPLLNTFLHVGRMEQCPTDSTFADPPTLSATSGNDPGFVDGLVQAGLDDVRAIASLRFIRRIGPRPLDMFASVLPRIVRDHVPASYFRALGIPLR